MERRLLQDHEKNECIESFIPCEICEEKVKQSKSVIFINCRLKGKILKSILHKIFISIMKYISKNFQF